MTRRNGLDLADTAHFDPPETGGTNGNERLEVTVVFTGDGTTLSALKTADALATRLGARITLIALEVVPYPAALNTPPVVLEFARNRLRTVARLSAVDADLRVYLCRDRWDALTVVLKPRSLVVLGARKRWWPTAESRLSKRLRRAGYEVVMAETE